MTWADPATWHPAASIFPLVSDAELAILAADIADAGLQNPLVIHEGLLLDGRNRARACALVNVKPLTVQWDGWLNRDPVAWVISQNLHRRHLNESQRAMAAARLATLEPHRPAPGSTPIGVLTQDEAAARLHVAARQVQRARVLLDHGVPELVALVDHARAAVSLAADLATEPAVVQRRVVKLVDEETPLRDAWRQVRAADRTTRPLPAGTYRVIYADPPWAYRDERAGLGAEERPESVGLAAHANRVDRATTAATHHYPTMPTDDICALAVAGLSAPDSVLFCWATFPLLEDALRVVRAWGFAYKTAFVWHKPRGSFGHYHKADAELLLVATRGSATPDIDTRASQVFTFPASGHSRKPDEARDLIDWLYPQGDRIELFARRTADGVWAVWGNEP